MSGPFYPAVPRVGVASDQEVERPTWTGGDPASTSRTFAAVIPLSTAALERLRSQLR